MSIDLQVVHMALKFLATAGAVAAGGFALLRWAVMPMVERRLDAHMKEDRLHLEAVVARLRSEVDDTVAAADRRREEGLAKLDRSVTRLHERVDRVLELLLEMKNGKGGTQ